MTSLKLGTPKRPAFLGHHNLCKNILFFTKKHIFYFFFHFIDYYIADKRNIAPKMVKNANLKPFVNRSLPKTRGKKCQKRDS